MDDIIILSKDADSHMQDVEEVLSRMIKTIYLFALQNANWARLTLEISRLFTLSFKKPHGNYSVFGQSKSCHGLACPAFYHGRARLFGFLQFLSMKRVKLLENCPTFVRPYKATYFARLANKTPTCV
jgi:hypothetical protein